MKKQSRKLTLAKETLVYLESSLGPVVGGATGLAGCVSNTGCDNTGCNFSGYHSCNTCGATCGTNLC
jgi:hypothetical protein